MIATLTPTVTIRMDRRDVMRIQLIAIVSGILLGLAFGEYEALAASKGGSGVSGTISPGRTTVRSGVAKSGMSGSRKIVDARDKLRQKQARARKSGDIVCTPYGWCRPLPCPAGKKADGTCW